MIRDLSKIYQQGEINVTAAETTFRWIFAWANFWR